MGIFTRAKNTSSFDWTNLEDEKQLDDLILTSYSKPVLLFKHSTRCSVSSMAKKRLEADWNIEEGKVTTVYLDILNHRDLSNKITERTGVHHQSPQAILLRNGAVVYHSSHEAIMADDIKKLVE
ncbi:MAG: bacillithiol system redox-active protein YtxJ [Crocinitomicaceae bacterium]